MGFGAGSFKCNICSQRVWNLWPCQNPCFTGAITISQWWAWVMVGLASIESPHNTQEAGPWATVESDINRGRLIPRLSAPLTSHKDNSSCWEKFSTFRFISAPLSSLLEWLPWPFIKTSDFDISLFFRSHQNFSVPLQKLAHEWWMIWELQESGLFSLSWLNLWTIYPN